MKSIKFLLIFLLTLIATQAKAQISQSHQMHQRMHQQALQTSIRTQQNLQHMQANSMLFNMKKTSEKYKFNFVMLNGDTIFNGKKTKIHFVEPIKEIIIKENKKDEGQTYTPSNTKSIFVKNGKNYIAGIPHRDHWLFETHSTDSIKFYAPFPEIELDYISAYQTLGDTIRLMSANGLEQIVKNNPKALKDAKKNKKANALNHYFRGLKKK